LPKALLVNKAIETCSAVRLPILRVMNKSLPLQHRVHCLSSHRKTILQSARLMRSGPSRWGRGGRGMRGQ